MLAASLGEASWRRAGGLAFAEFGLSTLVCCTKNVRGGERSHFRARGIDNDDLAACECRGKRRAGLRVSSSCSRCDVARPTRGRSDDPVAKRAGSAPAHSAWCRCSRAFPAARGSRCRCPDKALPVRRGSSHVAWSARLPPEPKPCAPASSTCRAPGSGRSEKWTVPFASVHVQAGAPLAALADSADNRISHLRMLQA